MSFHRSAFTFLLAQTALGLLLLAALHGQAQTPTQNPTPSQAATAASPTAYIGPSFPGGPDSLAAVLGRATRGASPALVGQLFLRLELDARGQVDNSTLLRPPADSRDFPLFASMEVQALAQQALRQLGGWQGSFAVGPAGSKPGIITLPLTFGLLAAQPAALAYADEEPTFSLTKRRSSPAQPAKSLAVYVQQQVRYPAAAFRAPAGQSVRIL